MKKILSTILAVAMLATLSTSVFANPMNESIVIYSVTDTFSLSIPETINVSHYYDNEVVIRATTNLSPETILSVRIMDGMDFMMDRVMLHNGNFNWVDTYFYYNDVNTFMERRIFSDELVAQFTGQNNDATDLNRALKIKAINPEGKEAGTYTAVVQFYVSFNDLA